MQLICLFLFSLIPPLPSLSLSLSPLSSLLSRSQTTERWRRLRVTLLLAVAYSANIGGTGTLIGSTPQLALKGIVEE